MNRIDKKCNAEYFQQILDGKKSFEVRLNDFKIDEGDTLVLREWNPTKKEYTGRVLEKRVIGVNKFMLEDFTRFWPQKDIDSSGKHTGRKFKLNILSILVHYAFQMKINYHRIIGEAI